ncbi:MAG TPA: hypothetical protein PK971_00735 [Saprospiraceae bacterium]|nr:hypothetical protein [Saprospiraceae bacterium]HND86816.1 hypothetical protein [Saprospiraceae bacterium]
MGRVSAQVFTRAVEPAVALSLGGANVAHSTLSAGIAHAAQLDGSERSGFFASTALPYGIAGWKTVRFQGFMSGGNSAAFGLDIAHGGTEGYTEQTLQVLYGRRMGKRWSLGLQAGMARVAAQEYGSAAAPTYGVSARVQMLPRLSLAASVQNPLPPRLAGTDLPAVLRIGAAWWASPIFVLLSEVEKDIERPTQVKAGLEYRPAASALYVRAGIRAGQAGRAALGLGLRLKSGLHLDVASEWHPSLGLTPAAMVSWRKARAGLAD